MIRYFLLLIAPLAAATFNPEAELLQVQEQLHSYLPGSPWRCQEIGTGNINYIYLAERGPEQLIVKKCFNFARINPEAFPLPVERLLYEYRAYERYGRIMPERIPRIAAFDPERSLLAMEYLTPHAVLRQGLIQGQQYPLLAEHMGTFLGRVLHDTSCYHLSPEEWQEQVASFAGNTSMREIILNINYTDPFCGSPLNHWSSPELDGLVASIQSDQPLKAIVEDLKSRFLTQPEALAHGDLHTGSIMVTPTDTRVFDTEFATYAPVSFDVGMLLANMAMASMATNDQAHRAWLASTTRGIWDVFASTFSALWHHPEIAVDSKLQQIWDDTLRLMGVEIIRRTIGVAHNADFESIAGRATKVAIEQRALQWAKELLLHGSNAIPDSSALESQLLA